MDVVISLLDKWWACSAAVAARIHILTPNLSISLMQSRNGIFIKIIWKVIYPKGV